MFAVDFAGRREEELLDIALRGQTQQLVSRVNVCFDSPDRVVGNQFDPDSGGQVKDHVDAMHGFGQSDRISDRAVAYLQTAVVLDIIQIVCAAGGEVVKNDHDVALAEKQFR